VQRNETEARGNVTEGQNGTPGESRQTQQNAGRQTATQQAVVETAQGRKNLTAEQTTKVRETVLNGPNVPRENNINFQLNVGTTVPTGMRMVEAPPTLIDIHPEWRGDRYFVVHDDVVVVDRNRKIVGLVPMGRPSFAGERETFVETAHGRSNLSAEQTTRIRETIFNGSNVPRDNDVHFQLNVGTRVPNEVRMVEVPPTLVDVYPEWRGDRYFVVRDEIVIVDQSERIVGLVPMGPTTAQLPGGPGFAGLSRDEVMMVQRMLNQRGFYVGEPDGVFGPETQRGLEAFQRQDGLQVTGEIDQPTLAALEGPNAGATTTGLGR
jgi:hypothetical protein